MEQRLFIVQGDLDEAREAARRFLADDPFRGAFYYDKTSLSRLEFATNDDTGEVAVKTYDYEDNRLRDDLFNYLRGYYTAKGAAWRILDFDGKRMAGARPSPRGGRRGGRFRWSDSW